MPRPAYVVDVDEETQKPVRGTGRSATTKEKEPSRSHRERSSRKRSDADVRSDRPIIKNLESPPLRRAYTDDLVERNVTVERRKSSSISHRRPPTSRQPSSRDDHHFGRDSLVERPEKRDESVYYGAPGPGPGPAPMPVRPVPLLSQPMPLRPRPHVTTTYARPSSFHGAYPPNYGSRPPLSNSAFYQTSQGPMPAPSYQPHPPHQPHQPAPPPSYANYTPSPDYFAVRPLSTQPTRSLSERFTPIERSSSAFSDRAPVTNRPAYDDYEDEDEDDEDEDDDRYDDEDDDESDSAEEIERHRRTVRRSSLRPSSARPAPLPAAPSLRKTKEEKDYELMPPPPKPKPILRRQSIDIPGSFPSESPRASPVPRTSPVRRSSPPPRESRTVYREETMRPQRQRPKRSSVSYNLDRDDGRYQIQTAVSGRPRRQSYYGQSASTDSSAGYEDKIRQASIYQEDVTGGPGLALTAELLKRQQRQEGSSRSTKSSGSHDESDFRRSATTRTTRSGSGEDGNVTIKVTGSAKLLVDGTQIECLEGGEIQIQRQNSLRNGSERAYSEYGVPRIEDRQSLRSGLMRHQYALEHPMENYI
ncbi:hypothetical protein F5884DRAFT_755125 [Xylogone sp. PMI_703]|nr:hypothetical protein F5884DRAFT_755125 [Xylogone sp. PMI_703]